MTVTSRPTRVCIAQVGLDLGRVEEHCALVAATLAEAVAAGADVVVLPELATSGYVFTSAEQARWPPAGRRCPPAPPPPRAGLCEVAVIADETADAKTVAADLLGQAEHGPQSPACLVTTSRQLGTAVVAEIERQLAGLSTEYIAGHAWRDYGAVYWAEDRETTVELMDILAPEHLEVITSDDDWYLDSLSNYGSVFLGKWSTVAYSDKGITGTNHVLPTGGVARSNAGLSVSRFLRPLTYQRVERSATPELAPHVERIANFEGMAAHEYTAALRTRWFAADEQ